jgi:hypothetical protein
MEINKNIGVYITAYRCSGVALLKLWIMAGKLDWKGLLKLRYLKTQTF